MLKYFGTSKGSLQWCTSYLENRKQSVSVNGILSETKNTVCGVPQGSVLDPIFFHTVYK